MTTVINIFGGPGCGKSTTAALLYGLLKTKRVNVELVQEYIKTWAWEERPMSDNYVLHFLGEQSMREATLYGKVDFLVTDSPILLAGIYPEYRSKGKDTFVSEAAIKFMALAESQGVTYKNFFIHREVDYVDTGRWESEEEAKVVDDYIYNYLKRYSSYSPPVIKGLRKAEQILDLLGDLKVSFTPSY